MNSYLKTKDFFNTQEEFDLLHDTKMDMLITHPQPSDLDTYYKSDAYISHSDSRQNFLDMIYHIVKKYSLNRKVRLIDSFNIPGKKLLDIGAGTGDFLLTAKNKNWITQGVEPNKLAKSKAAEKGILLHDNITAISQVKFDVITLWHVLEHLPNLDEQIDNITSLLNDKGILIVAVPNFKSYDAQKYKTFWAGFDVPRHLWHFSRTTIPLLFDKYNLELISTRPMYFDSYYVSLLSEKYKSGKTKLLSAAFTGFVSNLKAVYTKEYSSIIYVLKKG